MNSQVEPDLKRILRQRQVEGLTLTETAYAPGKWSTAHAHENARFVLVLQGTFSEIYERRTRYCSPFTFIFRPPGEIHAEDYHPNRVTCINIDVPSKWMQRLSQYAFGLRSSIDLKDALLSTLAIKLRRELHMQDQISDLAIEGLFLETVVEASRRQSLLSARRVPNWLIQAREFLHAHFLDNLTTAEIATAVSVHPIHLARVFRQYHHSTIAEYVRQLRIEFACSEISRSAQPLAHLAAACGFSDQSHFTKVFKRITGMTPAEYRMLTRSR